MDHRTAQPAGPQDQGSEKPGDPGPFYVETYGVDRFRGAPEKAKQEFLFPEEKADTLGLWGDALSDWFGRLITRLEIKGANMSFHSLRHSFEDALREADLHDTPIGNALTGRQGGGISKNYGTKFSTAKLVAAIESITYVGLTLSHLHAE